MTDPRLLAPPGTPKNCVRARHETARLEWRVGDGGDPARLVEQFCVSAGLPAADMRRPGVHRAEPGTVCGVAMLVSAAGGAAMIGGAVGPPTPVSAMPDVVVVAFGHSRLEAAAAEAEKFAVGPWRPSWSGAEHAAAVEQVRAAIGRGDVYQANVVGHSRADYTGDAAGVLGAVLSLPGASYGGALSGEGWGVASASPECFVDVVDGVVTTKPIKGTAPATASGAQELHSSVKERAEHVMIVDLERNDVARVARPGTVEVPELFGLREWCGLWQAESTVSAQLQDGAGLADLLRALCPPGSVTGTPKLAALDHIAAAEPVGRGPAMGALGYYTPERLSLGLTIRTVAVDESSVHVWAGGGITWRSVPEAEVAEAAAKVVPIKSALSR